MQDKYSKENLQKICADSYSYAEVIRKLGNIPRGGNYAIIKKYINLYDIDTSHFTHRNWRNSPNQINNPNLHRGTEQWTYDTLFVKNCIAGRKEVRRYIIRHNIFPYKCQTCGCDGNWMNGVIALELDHIDGDNTNNEINNLRFLCPNCHALTSTYRGKNKAKNNK